MMRSGAIVQAPSMGRSMAMGYLVLLYGCASSDQLDEASRPCTVQCSQFQVCTAGACTAKPCKFDGECGPEGRCADGRCELDIECETDDECPEGRCVNRSCFIPQCIDGEVAPCETACEVGERTCANEVWGRCDAQEPASEDTCDDQVDNDCDGAIDEDCDQCEEGLVEPCENPCGQGMRLCEMGMWSGCSVDPPDEEGACPCTDGTMESCGTPCGEGLRTCEASRWGDCLFEGRMCLCPEGGEQACSSACGDGIERCIEGQWTECTAPQPNDEICGNGMDEDCDEAVDEECTACQATLSGDPAMISTLRGSSTTMVRAIDGEIWVAAEFQGPPQKTRLIGLTPAGDRRFTRTIDLGRPLDLGPSPGGAVLLSAQTGVLSLSVHGDDGQLLTQTASPFGVGALEGLTVSTRGTNYVIWSENLANLRLQSFDVNGAQVGSAVNVLTSPQMTSGPTAAAGPSGITVVYMDDRDQDPQNQTLFTRRYDVASGGLSEEVRLFPGHYPALTYGPSALTLAYTVFEDGQHLVKLMQFGEEGQLVRAPRALFATDQPVSGLTLLSTDEGYALAWYLNREGIGHVYFARLDEELTPLQSIATITSGRSITRPGLAYTGALFAAIWFDAPVNPEGLLPADAKDLFLATGSFACP